MTRPSMTALAVRVPTLRARDLRHVDLDPILDGSHLVSLAPLAALTGLIRADLVEVERCVLGLAIDGVPRRTEVRYHVLALRVVVESVMN